LTVDEHTFVVVQAAADLGMPLAVRLAALFHDLGKPHVAWRGEDGRLHYYARPGKADRSHEELSADLADAALQRLRYPTDLRRRVVAIVRHHMLSGRGDALRARRLLARHGPELAFDLLDHKRADLIGKWPPGKRPRSKELDELATYRRLVEAERERPHRLRDLAVSGDDLLELGYSPGPAVGETLRTLLDEVVQDPSRNTRDALLSRARELLLA
jgi:tRNA nucleotidyltransferase (CCA-adding enzyme)